MQRDAAPLGRAAFPLPLDTADMKGGRQGTIVSAVAFIFGDTVFDAGPVRHLQLWDL